MDSFIGKMHYIQRMKFVVKTFPNNSNVMNTDYVTFFFFF